MRRQQRGGPDRFYWQAPMIRVQRDLGPVRGAPEQGWYRVWWRWW